MREAPLSMSTASIRKAFVSYFQGRGHHAFPAASLIPPDEGGLLFTNAGMNPFKGFFLGEEASPYPALVTVQPCMRAGGKQNDLEEVGYTRRHHTYFEMLGNFSFGSLSPSKAIKLAWEFLTHKEALGLNPNKLWVTFYCKDQETGEIWKGLPGLNLSQLVEIGDREERAFQSDNFWRMGDVGPCGPCTEIFYDLGPELEGTPPGPEQTGDRFMELWNLVLMKFSESHAGLQPLPFVSIDTGMGLERLACVLQGQKDNYAIDTFRQLILTLGRHFSSSASLESLTARIPFRILADHMRSTLALLNEGIAPSNQARGYVLRRIMRRTWLQCLQLEVKASTFQASLPDLFEVLQAQMSQVTLKAQNFSEAFRKERELFESALKEGHRAFEVMAQKSTGNHLSGAAAFRLYDTHGFPLDFIVDCAKSRGLEVDLKGFQAALAEQKGRSKKHQASIEVTAQNLDLEAFLKPLQPVEGYSEVRVAKVESVGSEAAPKSLKQGEFGEVSLERSPFAPAGGGVVSDCGDLIQWGPDDFPQSQALVLGVQKRHQTLIHQVWMVKGELEVGSTWQPRLNVGAHREKARHHTATHLLQYALRKVLKDEQLQQAGSSVHPGRLRFDFRCARPLKLEELAEVEREINNAIRACYPVQHQHMPWSQAQQEGALAFFSDRYQKEVQVFSFGPSKEVCGGPHAQNTGECGTFLILKESGISEGVRRIEACVSEAAWEKVAAMKAQLEALAQKLKCDSAQLTSQLERSLQAHQNLKSQCKQWVQMLSKAWQKNWLAQAESTRHGRLCMLQLDGNQYPMEGVVLALKSIKEVTHGCLAWQGPGPTQEHRMWVWVKQPTPEFSARLISEAIKAATEARGGGGLDFAQLTLSTAEALNQAWELSVQWLRKGARS